MLRVIVLLALGALAGAAAVLMIEERGAPAGAAADAWSFAEPFVPEDTDRAAPLPASSAPADSQAGFASLRLAIYETAAALGDAGALEARIEDVAGEPESPRRDLELEALLARLAELDARRAMRLAQSLFIDDRIVVAAFAAAAGTSAGDVLAELASVRRPALQRDMALALLDTLGDDDRTVERIAAELPASLRPSFEIRVLVRRAQRDATGAVRAAMRLDDPNLRQQALSEIAAALAGGPGEIDQFAALIEVEDPSFASSFRSVALSRWARTDPAAALDYLESASESGNSLDRVAGMSIVTAAAAAGPERLLGLMDNLPPELRSSAQSASIRAIADRDPLAAVRLFEAMPPGSERDNAARTIAQSYARRDPDAAIAWVTSLQPPPLDAMSAVISGVAAVDFNRAVDLVLQEVSAQGAGGGRASGLLSESLPFALSNTLAMSSLIASQRNLENTAGMTRLAEGLLALDTPQARSALSTMLGRWAQVDRARATDWVVANLTRVPPESIGNVAQQLARADLENAKRLTDSVPAAARAAWVASVAGTIAANDIAGATQWVERFRGQASYDAAMLQIVQRGAQYDPAGAAQLVERLTPASQARASTQLAMQWAQQDPAAATQWAQTIADETARGSALRLTVQQWARADVGAAARWARGLASATARDMALGSVFAGGVEAGTADTRLLDEISTGAAREQAVLNAVGQLARNDPEAARRLLTYVTTPTIREQAERMIEQAGRPSGLPFTIIN